MGILILDSAPTGPPPDYPVVPVHLRVPNQEASMTVISYSAASIRRDETFVVVTEDGHG